MKKEYQSPTMELFKVEVQEMIATSIGTGEYGGGQIQAIEYAGGSDDDDVDW